jgi:Poxvirus A32 protein
MNSAKRSCKICNVCNQVVCYASYSRHIKAHEPKYQCLECPLLNFNRRDNYLRHIKLHGYQAIPSAFVSTLSNQELNQRPAIQFNADEKQLKQNLLNFSVDPPTVSIKVNSAEFVHPFSCKIIGPRGTGKTSFMVSYVQKVACFRFHKIFIITSSPNQPLYITLKENLQIFFINLQELEAIVKEEKEILIVIDDMMQEVRYNTTLENLFTTGRHERISIMSLEQDPFYSSHVERRNADYFVLTRMRDTSCLNELYKKFCRDIQQWRFIDLYEFAMSKPFGFLIIDFVSQTYKYRVNSLNLYYDTQTFQFNHIDKDALQYDLQKIERKQFNLELQQRFTQSSNDFHSKRRLSDKKVTHTLAKGCSEGEQETSSQSEQQSSSEQSLPPDSDDDGPCFDI